MLKEKKEKELPVDLMVKKQIAKELLSIKVPTCGGCCWMIGEDHYGYGGCAHQFGEFVFCDDTACGKHLDKQKVRHSAAVLAQYKRCVHDDIEIKKRPRSYQIDEAIDIVARYINVISKTI